MENKCFLKLRVATSKKFLADDFRDKTIEMDKQKNMLHRWEVVLLVVLTPIIYLALCFITTNTEYNYPHRKLMHLFASELMPYVVILGFDVLWFVVMKYWQFGNKKVRILLTLLVLVLSAVAITDMYIINMWRHMMA